MNKKWRASVVRFAVMVFAVVGLFVINAGVVLAGCNLVCEGDFFIDDSETAADLRALSGCSSVTGNLTVMHSSLTSLQGLECLTYVSGNLIIDDNDALTSLDGLASLESVGDYLWIGSNHELCTSAAELLIDQLRDVGAIFITSNRD